MTFWDSALSLPFWSLVFLALALFVAFFFEFINGFHDTANAVATVIYTRTLPPTSAVIYSGIMNFMGALITVLFFGAAVAFAIVNLLPVELLVDSRSNAALVMVLSLLLAAVLWNLGTWYVGLPVSSSHTLIGCVIGVGIANGLWSREGMGGIRWDKALDVGLGLLFSPVFGFVLGGLLLLLMRFLFRQPRLYQPPEGVDQPPWWIRVVLIATCGSVSFAHGSNDGQKGMGLLLLVLMGFLPAHYALSTNEPELAPKVFAAAVDVRAIYEEYHLPFTGKSQTLPADLELLEKELNGKQSFRDLGREQDDQWKVRQAVLHTIAAIKEVEKKPDVPAQAKERLKSLREHAFAGSVEFVPVWVVVGTALALGIGTTVGYKRIVITVAEKIGKSRLNYAQGAAAQTVATVTILAADVLHLPVSTTQVLSSGVAGTMAANGSGLQGGTVGKILTAWVLTLPACVILSGTFFLAGRLLFR